MDFDGENNWLVATSDNDLDSVANNPYTIMGWIRVDGTGGTAFQNNSWFRYGSATNGYAMYLNSSNRMVVYNSGTTNFSPSYTFSTGTWYHVAITKDSTQKMYVNGSSEATNVAGGSYNQPSPGYCIIGQNYSMPNGSGGYTTTGYFNGGLSHVAAFNRELTSSEVYEAFDGPEPLNESLPTLSNDGRFWSATLGSWDTWFSKSNGNVYGSWELRKSSDDSVVDSGSGLVNSTYPSGGPLPVGEYYLWVRGTNSGGYDPAEDSVSSSITITTQTYNEAASGGGELSGNVFYRYDEEASGGVGSSGVVLITHEGNVSGGASMSATATVSQVRTEESTGGIEIGGDGRNIYADDVSGGVELGSSAEETHFGTGIDNELAADGSYDAWFTFRSLAIPKNSKIDKAEITVTAPSTTPGSGSMKIAIDAHCADDSDNPSTMLASYTRTGSTVVWEVPEFTVDQQYRTPNLAAIIEEVVSRANWNSGNDITFFLNVYESDTNALRRFVDREAFGYEATSLDIWYHEEFDETAEDGVVLGGSSASEVIRPTNGGVNVGGSLFIIPQLTEVEMDGGIIVSGETEPIGYIVMSGGATVSGGHEIGGTIVPTGGVLVGQAPHSNGYKYRLPFVISPNAVKEDFERHYPVIVVYVDPDDVETGTDFKVEDDEGNTVLHHLRLFDDETGKVVFSIKTPLDTEGNQFVLFYGRQEA
ncbi:hypothetical protein C5Y96_09895 [Blastopirellula marina]|uniref:LamG-like jellyroll fold domain-containing protein n=1 Tax=Blastopirellula marina TaxID=124 RepID=A0A2S8FLU6_9BACT|nr:hypothetical protein C5Y96_09895 [Blastopirellula marina]RCS52251.1 LamG domain-containing protein [Bremerella cremea]